MFSKSVAVFLAITTLNLSRLGVVATPVESVYIDDNHAIVPRTIDSSEVYAQRSGNESIWMSYHPSIEGRDLELYNYDCEQVGQVCSNICFYIDCKGAGDAGLTQTKASSRFEAPGCNSKLNRCSQRWDGDDGPFASGYSCDEYPMSSTSQARTANAATRCVPVRENSKSGGGWKAVAVGASRKTNLLNPAKAEYYCERFVDSTKTTDCSPPGDTARQM